MRFQKTMVNDVLPSVWLVTSIGVIGCLTGLGQAQEKSKPNIVLVNADDLGYGDLGCYGAVHVNTPNIDRLAREGRRFTDAHSASVVCSPSRYGLLTGRYPLRRNFWGPVGTRQPLTIDTSHLTLGKLMKEAGYNTSCIGKWHLGMGDHLFAGAAALPFAGRINSDVVDGKLRANAAPAQLYDLEKDSCKTIFFAAPRSGE